MDDIDLLELSQGYQSCDADGYADQYIIPLQRMIKNDSKRSDEYKALLNSILDTNNPYHGLSGNNYMWTSGLMSHIRNGYGVNIRMTDNNIKTSEWRATWPANATNTGNLIYWTANAASSVMVDGDEYYTVYKVYDWRHIPGVTAPFALSQNYGSDTGNSDCWGVSNGITGATAYKYNKDDGTNSYTCGTIGYFFFNNEYVALGAGISSNHDKAIHTTINQTKSGSTITVNGENLLPGTDNKIYTAGYVYNNKIGYIFPKDTEIHVSNINQEEKEYPSVWGTGYSQFENSENLLNDTKNVFTLWINHGKQPQNSSYAYIVLPNSTEKEVYEYSENSPIQIIKNTEDIQAVSHRVLKQTQINFYNPGTLEYAEGKIIKVNTPCSLIIDESGNNTLISASVSNLSNSNIIKVDLTNNQKTTTTLFYPAESPYTGQSITLTSSENESSQ